MPSTAPTVGWTVTPKDRDKMAYFPNGTAGELYEERYCSRCRNNRDDDCPIWTLHLIWNYDQNSDATKHIALDALIPTTDDGNPGECYLFIPAGEPL